MKLSTHLRLWIVIIATNVLQLKAAHGVSEDQVEQLECSRISVFDVARAANGHFETATVVVGFEHSMVKTAAQIQRCTC